MRLQGWLWKVVSDRYEILDEELSEVSEECLVDYLVSEAGVLKRVKLEV